MKAEEAAEMLKKTAFVCLKNVEKTLKHPDYCENFKKDAAIDWVTALFWGAQSIRRVAELERENKALLHDLRTTFDPCYVCKKQGICEQYCQENDYNCPECKDKGRCICHNCTADNDLWKWRGVCEANSK